MAKNTGFEGFPRLETIRAVAATLSSTETAVVLAFAKSLGLEVTTSRAGEIPLPAGAEKLTGQQRQVVWDLVLSYLTTGAMTEAAAQQALERNRRVHGISGD